MDDKWKAQQTFWESFGLPAYDENTVPDNAVMPYITYEAVGGRIDESTTVSASLWYRSSKWLEISRKADQIAQAIAEAQVPAIKILNGYMRVRLPDVALFAQRMEDPSDKQIRRILMTVEMEFLTAY